jgi:phage terminase large subunit-like protein
MYEIQDYIWDAICKETGNYQEKTVEPEMVNKAEFIKKLENWIRGNTDWHDEYNWEGRNPNYGLWDELKKYLEE